MSEWREFGSRAELDTALAAQLAADLRADLGIHARSSLAVSGGSTPRHMFQLLAATELDWSRVAITLVDERWVDATDPDSNEALVRDCLLQDRAAAASFVGLKTPGTDCAAAVAEVTAAVSGLPRPLRRCWTVATFTSISPAVTNALCWNPPSPGACPWPAFWRRHRHP